MRFSVRTHSPPAPPTPPATATASRCCEGSQWQRKQSEAPLTDADGQADGGRVKGAARRPPSIVSSPTQTATTATSARSVASFVRHCVARRGGDGNDGRCPRQTPVG